MENNIFTDELKEEIFKDPEVYHCVLTREELKQIYFEIERLNNKINKALEIIELMKPELWNISNKMTYRLIDIKNVLEEKE